MKIIIEPADNCGLIVIIERQTQEEYEAQIAALTHSLRESIARMPNNLEDIDVDGLESTRVSVADIPPPRQRLVFTDYAAAVEWFTGFMASNSIMWGKDFGV